MGMEKFKGNFLFDGKEINNVRKQLLVMWDDCPFYTNLSGLKNLIIFSENIMNKKQIQAIISRFLNSELLINKVRNYSYVQKNILTLAFVEILHPRYIIL